MLLWKHGWMGRRRWIVELERSWLGFEGCICIDLELA